MTRKKAISPIITTILLILISITAIIFIYSIIMPFVSNNLTEGKECFDVLNQITINTESGYTCYYDESGFKIVNLTVKRGQKELSIQKFKISVNGEGKNELFSLQEGPVDKVKMLSGSTTIELPRTGEERTYSLSTTLTEVAYVEIYPVVESGITCEAKDKINIERCGLL